MVLAVGFYGGRGWGGANIWVSMSSGLAGLAWIGRAFKFAPWILVNSAIHITWLRWYDGIILFYYTSTIGPDYLFRDAFILLW